MIFVPTSEIIPQIMHYEGQVARAIDPINLDRRQAYLISGRNPPVHYAFTQPGSGDRKLWCPVLLPPWCGEVRVAVRAIRTSADGQITCQVQTSVNGVDVVGLSAYLEIGERLDSGTLPASEVAWGSVSFAGLGGLQTQGDIALSLEGVTNAFRHAWLWLDCVDCVVHDVLIRCWPSSAAITE